MTRNRRGREQIDCEEAVRRLAEYLDRELSQASRAEMKVHLQRCRDCFSRAEFERRLKARIRENLHTDQVPQAFHERMKTLVEGLGE